VAITADLSAGFVKKWKPTSRQRLERRSLHVFKLLSDLTLRCAMNPHVGRTMLPVKQRLTLSFKAGVGPGGEGIVLDILYT
jgi:hypothetical protein